MPAGLDRLAVSPGQRRSRDRSHGTDRARRCDRGPGSLLLYFVWYRSSPHASSRSAHRHIVETGSEPYRFRHGAHTAKTRTESREQAGLKAEEMSTDPI